MYLGIGRVCIVWLGERGGGQGGSEDHNPLKYTVRCVEIRITYGKY